jgi:CheY-like chemotaxis protein
MAEDQQRRWILLVDDDEGVRDALGELLTFAGYEVKAVRDGQQALDCLRGTPMPPAIILLDLMMPVMDGFEFRALQQRDPQLADIPVLVLTAGAMTDRVHGLQAAGYFPKPLNVDRLLAELEVYASEG